MTFPAAAQAGRDAATLRLHGAYFGVATGDLSVLRQAPAAKFEPVPKRADARAFRRRGFS